MGGQRRLSQSSVWGGAMAVPPSMFREASLVMFRETSALSTMQSQSRQSSSAEVDPERVATAATADSNEWVDVDVSWTPIIASLLLALVRGPVLSRPRVLALGFVLNENGPSVLM